VFLIEVMNEKKRFEIIFLKYHFDSADIPRYLLLKKCKPLFKA